MRPGTRVFAAAFGSTLLFTVSAAAGQSTPDSAGIELAKPVIRAGETVEGTITLDRAPDFDGGVLRIIAPPLFDCRGGTPGHPGELSSIAFATGLGEIRGIPVHKGVSQYHFFCSTDQYGSGATIRLGEIQFLYSDLRDPYDPRGHWTVRELRVSPTSFEIEPNAPPKRLTRGSIPTSAAVEINPSQIQLLRGEARVLQARTQDLTSALKSLQSSEGSERDLLLKAVTDSLRALEQTESRFMKFASNGAPENAGRIFFDDLRVNYDEARQNLGAHAGLIRQRAGLQPAAWGGPKPSGYSPVAQVVLRAMEMNTLAYDTLADSQSDYFDLRVESDPANAKVSYKRRTDPNFIPSRDPTNSTISKLPYAFWEILFQLPGKRDCSVEFNPFTEREKIVSVSWARGCQ